MRKVYMSFLGTGEYKKTIYSFNGELAKETQFVQVAEFELLGNSRPDVAYILVTDESQKKNFFALQEELQEFNIFPEPIILAEDMSSQGQWTWLEQILQLVREGDRLTLDLTHGYRSLPIIFSTALNFLQKTQQLVIEHVFYGAYEMNREQPPIIDMKKFYDINIWADAVTRLTLDADAGGIAAASSQTNRYQFPELVADDFVKSCNSVTSRIKSVDVNNVAEEVTKLLKQIDKLRSDCSPGARILLDMVYDKFIPLIPSIHGNKDNNRYENEFFRTQIELVRLLIDHKLFMQAFTVIREFLVSIADMFAVQRLRILFDDEWKGKKNRSIKKYKKDSRIRFAEPFPAMLTIPEKKWDFHSNWDKGGEKFLKVMEPVYRDNHKQVLLQQMKDLFEGVKEYRNGFDHGWMNSAGMKHDLEEKGRYFLKKLEDIMVHLSI